MSSINEVICNEAKRQSLEKRFWEKVEKRQALDCWPWVAKAKHKFGYGAISAGRGNVFLSHVVSWALTNGDIPKGAYVLHSCDNPWCCNPKHLKLGDHQGNMTDVKERGRRVGRQHSPETIEKIKAGRAANPPKQTEAARSSRSQAMKRRWESEEWRERFAKLTSGDRHPTRRRKSDP